MHHFFLAVLGIFFTGCAITRIPYLGETKTEYRLPRLYNELHYDQGGFRVEVIPEEDRETENYKSYQIRLIAASQNGQGILKTKGRYLQNKSAGKKKLIVLVPIYGSSTFPPEMAALALTEWNSNQDTNALLIEGRKGLFDWTVIAKINSEADFHIEIKKTVKNTVGAVGNIRRLLDWAATRPEIDEKRIGIVGFSIGAIVGSIIMGVDERISVGVFVAGGGNLAEILTYSQAQFILKPREAILRRLDWSQEILLEKLSQHLAIINPVRYEKNINPQRVLVIEAAFDEYIPAGAREIFWISLGRPERIILGYSHKTMFLFTDTILGLNYMDRTIAKFFAEKL